MDDFETDFLKYLPEWLGGSIAGLYVIAQISKFLRFLYKRLQGFVMRPLLELKTEVSILTEQLTLLDTKVNEYLIGDMKNEKRRKK